MRAKAKSNPHVAHIKIRPGSALDQHTQRALTTPGAQMTARIHEIAERYDAVLDAVNAAHRLSEDEEAMFVGAMRYWPLPPATEPSFRLQIMARVAYYGATVDWTAAKRLTDRIESMTLSALILAVEQAEQAQ